MTKYLLLALFIALLFYGAPWRRLPPQVRRPATPEPPRRPMAPPPAQEAIVECAHCGLHLPASEAVADTDGHGHTLHYCSQDHRRAGPRPS